MSFVTSSLQVPPTEKLIIGDVWPKSMLARTGILFNSDLYTQELNKKGIETINPNEEQLKVVENIIRSVIAGTKNNDYKTEYIKVLNELLSKGADAIILGCTELPLAVNYEALGNRTINSDEVLAEGIVDYFYLNEK